MGQREKPFAEMTAGELMEAGFAYLEWAKGSPSGPSGAGGGAIATALFAAATAVMTEYHVGKQPLSPYPKRQKW